MVRGETPVVLLSDDHPLHGKEHTAAVASPAARRDPNVLRAYREHMHEHYSLFYGVPPEMVEMDPLYRQRFLMLCGRPVPPEPMGPPPGPTPGPVGPGAAAGGPEAGPLPEPNMAATGPQLGAELPSMPTNPATGQEWNPVTGGGVVPR